MVGSHSGVSHPFSLQCGGYGDTALLGFVSRVFDRHDDVLPRMVADHVDVTRLEVDRDLCLGVDGLYGVLDHIGAMAAAHARDLKLLAHRGCSFKVNEMQV